MTIDVKHLGTVERFNGVDVLQSRHFVKIFNQTYIDKICSQYKWIENDNPISDQKPVPMIATAQYQRQLHTAITCNETELKKLEKQHGFGYRKAIGELIYAMVTCRPDISYAVIKLSQYSTRPSHIHFDAVKNVYKYLHATKTRGITYWRHKPRLDLLPHAFPEIDQDNNYDYNESIERKVIQPDIINAAVDSDYAGDHQHRKSVTGFTIQLAGGTILYKTRYQDTIALSSTEAEFTAAAEAGKYILYVRSILDELGIEQHLATTLYEDNQGAPLMANAQQPTKRTRHMDIKTLASLSLIWYFGFAH